MEHASYYVDVLDSSGKVIGKKRRKDIDKRHDIYKSVHLLLITPKGEVVLTRIKQRNDLPNIYSDHYGATAATIIRNGETTETAAHRLASRELFIDDADVHLVGEAFETDLRDGKKEYIAFYYLIDEIPFTYSKTDIDTLLTFSPNDISRQLVEHPDEFAPIFALLWEKYSDALPL